MISFIGNNRKKKLLFIFLENNEKSQNKYGEGNKILVAGLFKK